MTLAATFFGGINVAADTVENKPSTLSSPILQSHAVARLLCQWRWESKLISPEPHPESSKDRCVSAAEPSNTSLVTSVTVSKTIGTVSTMTLSLKKDDSPNRL